MEILLLNRFFAWLFHGIGSLGMTADDSASEQLTEDLREAEWLRQVANGDTQALRKVFDRWKLPLLTYFYRAIGSHADAEDLTLQTLTIVYRSASRYRPEARFSSWLFAIARNELRHELRRRKRKPVDAVLPDELESLGADGSVAARHTREVEEQMLEALQELPERERSALLMATGGELTNGEIAAALGVTTNHLNVLLHRARQKLRSIFSKTR